jgi:hypothetical protein
MTEQPTIPGLAERDEALERVERNADDEWKQAAIDAVRWLAQRRTAFTTDAVWHVMRRDYQDAHTHEPRALGATMRKAAGLGLVEPTDEHRLSTNPDCHRRPKRVWRSLIMEQQP